MLNRPSRKTKEGVVVGNKMDKTAVVEVERLFMHPFYKKTMKISKKFKAHDEENKCKVGDKVKIEETKPISKDKNWRIAEILTAEGPVK